MDLIELIQVRGAGAGSNHSLTPKAYENAKRRGKLKDFKLASEVESVEIEEIEDDEVNLDDEIEEVEGDGLANIYDEAELKEKTKNELGKIISEELKLEVPKNVNKDFLIEMIIENQ